MTPLLLLDVVVLAHLADKTLLSSNVFLQVFGIAAASRPSDQTGNVSGFGNRELRCALIEISIGSLLDTIGAITEVNFVEVKLQNFVL